MHLIEYSKICVKNTVHDVYFIVFSAFVGHCIEHTEVRGLSNLKNCVAYVYNQQQEAIRNRRQRTDIGKYSFVNRTIRLWNRLPAEILETLPCKPNAFRKRVRKVINVVN
jgi:hypothetical protein